jgi:hypothetical protein
MATAAKVKIGQQSTERLPQAEEQKKKKRTLRDTENEILSLQEKIARLQTDLFEAQSKLALAQAKQVGKLLLRRTSGDGYGLRETPQILAKEILPRW